MQMTIDLSEKDYRALQAEAARRSETVEDIACKYLSIARVLSQGSQAEQSRQWPEGYFELFGGWQGAPLARAPQGEYEKRLEFD